MSTVYDIITDRLVTALESGVAPWRRPWANPKVKPGELGSYPANAISRAPYRGVNVFLTTATAAAYGYEHPFWLTFKQAIAKGCPVRKGEKATPIVFWKWLEKGRDEATGKPIRIPLLRYYSVFNVAQLNDGWETLVPTRQPADEPEPEPTVQWSPINLADAMVARYRSDGGPTLSEGTDPRAYYVPSRDHVHMPDRVLFPSAQNWYGVLFHELGHSTGYADRLNRPGITDPSMFGSHAYSREELVAEMTAAFLCGATGILTPDLEANAAAYLAGWVKALRGDAKLAIIAGAQAQKAADLIRGVQYGADAGEPETLAQVAA
jgi:antirestriction protein ArdC